MDKETEGTRRVVHELQEALGGVSRDPKSDPYLVRLAVDRQLGRQIEEENYLHRVCQYGISIRGFTDCSGFLKLGKLRSGA